MVEHTSRRQGIMQRMELIDERNEMRDMIKELGGEDPLNIIKSYLGQEDPRIIEGRYRSGKPRTQMVEGLTIKGLEPQTMEEKQIIADLLKQYGSMSEISRAIEAGELAIGAAAIPALIKAGVKGVRKLKDPAVRDMLTPNIFKSSKQGPLTAVGANVAKVLTKGDQDGVVGFNKFVEEFGYTPTSGELARYLGVSRKRFTNTDRGGLKWSDRTGLKLSDRRGAKAQTPEGKTKRIEGFKETMAAKEIETIKATTNYGNQSHKFPKIKVNYKGSEVSYEDAFNKMIRERYSKPKGVDNPVSLNMFKTIFPDLKTKSDESIKYIVSSQASHLGLKMARRRDPKVTSFFRRKELDEFLNDPDVPKTEKLLRKRAFDVISKFNQMFPQNKKNLDHINSFWNSVQKNIPYEDIKNLNVIDEKLNYLKMTLYEAPNAGLQNIAKKWNKASFSEKKKLKLEYDKLFEKHKKLIKKAKGLIDTEGLDWVPRKFRIEKTNTAEGLSKQLDELQTIIDQETDDLARFADEGNPNFKKGGRVGFAPFGGLVQSVQDEIKEIAASDTITRIKKPVERKFEEIQQEAKTQLRTERPVKFKASEFSNLAEEFVFKPAGTLMTAPMVGALNAIEFAYNKSRQGVENDIDMKEKFPQVYKLFNYYTSGIGPTPDEQTYIGFLDETIRSVQKGGQNLGYSVLDLAYTIPDFAFGTTLQERLKTEYDKHAFTDPETFLGNAGSILVEFGVPSGIGLKFVNFMRKGLQKTTGINLFTRSTYGMKGAQKAATTISNVAKRVGAVAPSAFIGEFVGGSQYNTVSREFADDPLFLDQTLGYDFIDTTNLSGRELQVANFTNRLRFGADGAIVAGMFPLVGPALFKATKYGVIKPSAYVAGKGLQAVNYLGIKPVSYLLARTPVVAQTGQLGAKALGLGASFLGKDVLSRAAIGLMGTPTLKQLPDFKDWRMFEVTSSDPVERNLRRFDNFLSLFRDSANQSANRFFITGQTDRKIKALSRKVEKQLDSVEVRAYDLATGFLKDYNSKTTSPAKQQYYLDQVMAYMKGQIKKADLPEPLQESAEALNKTFMQIKREFADVLPEGAGLKDFLNSNLRQYMRASFATFTNPLYRPDKQTFDRAVDFMVDRINKNENMVEAAIRASNQPTDVAIKEFARKQVESMLQRGKADNRDPLDVLNFIARQNLKMDDLVVQTGEELPAVIRKLMGEENTLRGSVMMTATDLASQTANLQMYNKLTKLGLDEGWLFRSSEEAIAAGVINPKLVGPRLPGLGKLDSQISQAYGSEDIVNSIVGSSGLLDGLLKNNLYQSLIAYKAMVQTGKTVYSPATQTRNFGSAGFFPLQSGHIGGAASVQDAFKIMLDDIFGAGRIADEQQLIDRITRKIELGVLDENVVVSELKDILQDLKKAKFKSFGELAERIDNTRLSQTATRLYAGGDNVWKWYGHEFVMSQLKNGFKNVDELVKEYKQTFKVDINPKTLEEGIEQYAATLVRDTYPTYSKVPKAIQLIRRVPFIGNFVSFPAEILRTTFTTSALAAKHIMSNNPTLRELGYRTLIGQYITYGGIGAGVTYLGQAMSNLDSQQLSDLKEYFAPEFMRYSDLVPLEPMEDGVVKVFDNSRYFPYDLITSTTGNLINRMFTQREQLDPDKIETDMFKDIYNYTGPFADLAGGTLLGTAIGYEPALTFLTGGRTKTGSRIYADTDTTVEKFDKMFAYTFETINPGFVRTLQNLYRSFAGMLTGTGQPIKPEDEVFKLFGGSAVTIDTQGSFRFKIGNLKSSFREPKVAEDFFRPDFRTAAQLVREYNDQNEEAFREQYEFFKLVRAAKRSGFMSDADMRKVLEDRVGKSTAENILRGFYTPLSYSEDALEGRFENIKRGNPDEIFSRSEFLPFTQLESAKRRWKRMKFEDFEREMKEPDQTSAAPVVAPQQTAEAPEPQVPPLPDTPQPTVSPVNVTNQASATTGLTDAESVYLGPTEQLYRRRERGIT
jgi:hypothetical protein